MLSVDEVQEFFSEGSFVLLARCQPKLDRLSVQGDDRVEFRREPATRSPERIGGRSTASSGGVLVRPNDRGVED